MEAPVFRSHVEKPARLEHGRRHSRSEGALPADGSRSGVQRVHDPVEPPEEDTAVPRGRHRRHTELFVPRPRPEPPDRRAGLDVQREDLVVESDGEGPSAEDGQVRRDTVAGGPRPAHGAARRIECIDPSLSVGAAQVAAHEQQTPGENGIAVEFHGFALLARVVCPHEVAGAAVEGTEVSVARSDEHALAHDRGRGEDSSARVGRPRGEGVRRRRNRRGLLWRRGSRSRARLADG